MYTPVIWNLQVPPRIHIFLWLLSNNKTLTRSNLARRRSLEDVSCLFCSEIETVHHLFFDCCVARTLRSHVSDIFDIHIGSNYESVARWWVSNKRNSVLNMTSAALLWSLWKLRNSFCFQGEIWRDERVVLNRIIQALKHWRPLCKEGNKEKYDWVVSRILEKSRQPLRLIDGESVPQRCSTSERLYVMILESANAYDLR